MSIDDAIQSIHFVFDLSILSLKCEKILKKWKFLTL